MSKVSSFVHLNNNQLCALDLRDTGTELIELAILPLGPTLDIHTRMKPIDLLIRPQFPLEIKKRVSMKDIQKALDTGHDRDLARDIFDAWFNSLFLEKGKKIVVLTYDWLRKSYYLKEWLGEEHFDYYFFHDYRDLFNITAFMNDRATFADEQIPYPGWHSTDFKRIIKDSGIVHEWTESYDAVFRAHLISRVYKKMLVEVMI